MARNDLSQLQVQMNKLQERITAATAGLDAKINKTIERIAKLQNQLNNANMALEQLNKQKENLK